MSDEDKEIDVESGDDVVDYWEYKDRLPTKKKLKVVTKDEELEDGMPQTFSSLEEKRAHHNALERKRRDHIKDSFSGLRDSIPSLEGEKSSRAQILHKATEHIQYMRRKNISNQVDIDELKRHNTILDQQVRQLEKARASGSLPLEPAVAALLTSDLLLQPSTETSTHTIQTDTSSKHEQSVLLERPDRAGDHDDYTIAPKRLKSDPS